MTDAQAVVKSQGHREVLDIFGDKFGFKTRFSISPGSMILGRKGREVEIYKLRQGFAQPMMALPGWNVTHSENFRLQV